jgi:hypothetical protein
MKRPYGSGRVYEKRGAYYGRWRKDDLVFAHPELGVPLDRTEVARRFQAALPKGVLQIRFHDPRHTFDTTLAAAGVPLRTIHE